MRFNLWKISTFVLGSALAVTIGTSAIHTAQAAPQAIAEKQPHMEAALAALRTARDELNLAAEDKGGHRAAALKLTNDAIKQTEDGVAFANKK